MKSTPQDSSEFGYTAIERGSGFRLLVRSLATRHLDYGRVVYAVYLSEVWLMAADYRTTQSLGSGKPRAHKGSQVDLGSGLSGN